MTRTRRTKSGSVVGAFVESTARADLLPGFDVLAEVSGTVILGMRDLSLWPEQFMDGHEGPSPKKPRVWE